MSELARVRVSTIIAVDPQEAFRIFTEEVDLWWKRSPRFRVSSDPKGTRSSTCSQSSGAIC